MEILLGRITTMTFEFVRYRDNIVREKLSHEPVHSRPRNYKVNSNVTRER